MGACSGFEIGLNQKGSHPIDLINWAIFMMYQEHTLKKLSLLDIEIMANCLKIKVGSTLNIMIITNPYVGAGGFTMISIVLTILLMLSTKASQQVPAGSRPLYGTCQLSVANRQDAHTQPDDDQKRDIALSEQIQQQIARLERELTKQRMKLEKLQEKMSAPPPNNPSIQMEPARIRSFASDLILIDRGLNGGFRIGDKVVLLRRTDKGIVLTGQAEVTRVYPIDAEIDVITNLVGIKPDDEVYITSSPYARQLVPVQN